MRATASAILLFMLNLIGQGIGPQLVGILSDWLQPTLGRESIRYALIVAAVSSLWGSFHFFRASAPLRAELARTRADGLGGPPHPAGRSSRGAARGAALRPGARHSGRRRSRSPRTPVSRPTSRRSPTPSGMKKVTGTSPSPTTWPPEESVTRAGPTTGPSRRDAPAGHPAARAPAGSSCASARTRSRSSGPRGAHVVEDGPTVLQVQAPAREVAADGRHHARGLAASPGPAPRRC